MDGCCVEDRQEFMRGGGSGREGTKFNSSKIFGCDVKYADE